MCLRERVRALLVDRVLRRKHQEHHLQRVRVVSNCDLALLHGLEQGALDLGRRAVDFVGKDEVGEDRPLVDGELGGAWVVDLGADEVGRQ